VGTEMAITFEEFKKYTQQREYGNFRNYQKIISNLSELYNVEDFIFFYPKNIQNEKPDEFVFFLNEGYLLVTHDNNGKFVFEHINCKVVRKSLFNTSNTRSKFELKLIFDNGHEMILNDLEDSNADWVDEYSNAIKEIYKIVK
jgi:hypothetical protein